MNSSLNGQEKFQYLRTTGTRSGRERSASPHPPTVRGDNQLSRWSTNSVSSGTATSGPPAQYLQRRADLHPTLSQAVEEYSRGEIGYSRALRAATMFIEGVASLSDTEQDRTFLKFYEAINGTARHREELQRRRGTSPTRGEPEKGDVGKRDWRELRTKDGRLRLSERECPWYKSRADGGISPTESQRKTRESLEYLRSDIEQATQWVKSAPGAPKCFPESEWKNIVCGEAVNLGRVLASRFPSATTEAKFVRVKDNVDWYLAWSATAKATAFVFPHRQKELDQYSEYITKRFSARKPAYRHSVILFDEAIRAAVGGGESSSLLDDEICRDLYEKILRDNCIPEYQVHQPRQLCFRFNGKVGCGDSYCRYEHRCRSCKQGDHGQANCQKRGQKRKRCNKA